MKGRSPLVVLVKGGGEMGTGVAHRLARCGFHVCLTDIPEPQAVRRGVTFSEAVFEGWKEVEGLVARRVAGEEEIWEAWKKKTIPLLVDPECQIRKTLRAPVLVDAILAKKNTGTRLEDASLVIGLGPGFFAGRDVHLVVETNRGHNLGRVIEEGEAEPDTGRPGEILGYSWERVLRAPAPGRFRAERQIGDCVEKGERVAEVAGVGIEARVGGVIRGLIRDGLFVAQGGKVGDIDPRGNRAHCFTISDKARAIAGGVLEAIFMRFPPFEERG